MSYPKKMYREGDLTYEVVVANKKQEDALPEGYTSEVTQQSQPIAWVRTDNLVDQETQLQLRKAEIEESNAELQSEREKMRAEHRAGMEEIKKALAGLQATAKDEGESKFYPDGRKK